MSIFLKRTAEFRDTFDLFVNQCEKEISHLSEIIVNSFTSGGKLLICGNGGSAADAQHLAAEFVSSFAYGLGRKSLPAISLTVDTSILTAISNDFDFEKVFARQVQGLGKRNDCLLAISTSGASKNCLLAVEEAKSIGMQTLALTRAASPLYAAVQAAVGIPSSNTQQIQECHIISYHILTELVEEEVLRRQNGE
jgi:D-sedoheptulose 7-phosphate isomerase